MTANHRKDALEVAHITGVQGIRAALADALGEEGECGGKPFIRVTPYLLCPPETPLKLDDIIRREKDGAHYRVCSRPEDRRTPLGAGFPYAEVRLERMEADA